MDQEAYLQPLRPEGRYTLPYTINYNMREDNSYAYNSEGVMSSNPLLRL